MQIKIWSTYEELEDHEAEWNNLLLKSASHVPFLRHEYIKTWWKTLGGGEWQDGTLHIITAHSNDGEIKGIAPLFRTTNLDGKSALMIIGSIEISDYLDFLAAPEDLPDFIDAVLKDLEGPQGPVWEILDLYNIPEESQTLARLDDAVQKLGWNITKERIQPAPYILIPHSWNEYLKGIKKKQRHEIRRKLKRAENHDTPVSWYFVQDEDSLDEEIKAFLDLMALDNQKEEFLTDIMRKQMGEAIHTAFNAGWLQLSFLMIGEEKAAAYLNFDYANKLWVYNSAINFDFYDLSPGWVLLAYLIQWAIENGREVLDFMRGDEVYKYRFGGIDRYVMRVQITR
jgi:CelD/BcsL family acetyltransferase involved in cellulose biosynthesis